MAKIINDDAAKLEEVNKFRREREALSEEISRLSGVAETFDDEHEEYLQDRVEKERVRVALLRMDLMVDDIEGNTLMKGQFLGVTQLRDQVKQNNANLSAAQEQFSVLSAKIAAIEKSLQEAQ